MTDQDDFFIAKQIAEHLSGCGENEQANELEEWRQHEKNERLLKRIEEEAGSRMAGRRYDDFSCDEGWKSLSAKRKRMQRIRNFYRFSAVAAVLIVLVGSVLFFRLEKSVETVNVESVPVAGIEPGKPRARLLLPGGTVVDLEKERGMIADSSAMLHDDTTGLIYQFADGKKNGESVIHEVDVPVCGEFRLQLSDGTVVYLNAQSRLRFPNYFTGKTREVELEGEAYFDVATDSVRPFIVKTAYNTVKVYGTEFNVSAYSDEPDAHTTLVEGSVSVERENVVSRLYPGEQWHLNKSNGEVAVNEVDVETYSAWKNGRFRFKDTRLEDIMRAVSRWYGVKVVFQNEDLKGLLFGCNFSRHSNILPLIRVFEANGKVVIEQQDNLLIIKKGR